MGSVAGSTRLASNHMTNLVFQLQDVFVSLMSGQKPMTVLIQQGSQIGGIMMQAGMGVMAFTRALVGMAAAGVAAALTNPILLGIAAAAALAYAAFKSFQMTVKSTGELDAYAKSLGLTNDEMKKLSSTGVTVGDVFRGIWKTISEGLNLQKVFSSISDWWSKAMKVIGDVTLNVTAAIYAYYSGSFNAIKLVWDNFPRIMKGAAIGAVNAVIAGVEMIVNKSIDGLNKMINAANAVASVVNKDIKIANIETIKLTRMANENGTALVDTAKAVATGYTSAFAQAKKLGGAIGENIIAASKDRIATEAAAIAAERNAKAKGATAAAARQAAAEVSNLADELERLVESTLTPAERAARDAAKAVDILRRAFDAGLISAEDMHAMIRKLDGELETMVVQIPKNISGLKTLDSALKGSSVAAGDFWSKLDSMSSAMSDAFQTAENAVNGVFQAIAGQNWAGAVSAAVRGIKAIGASYNDMRAAGMTAGQAGLGVAGGVAGAVAPMVGGRLGAGLAGFSAGASMVSALGTLMPSLAVSGPVGWAIAAGMALFAAFGGSKPSNNAAISNISGSNFSITGDKRNDQTTQLAQAASQGIIAGQDALLRFGATLNTTVTSIDIGTRDLTHIFLNNGNELRSAVADAGDAVKVGLEAVLAGAKFMDEGQQKFVDTMRAAGKGFDEVIAALERYKSAQLVGAQIEDEILRLTDPQDYEMVKLLRSQKETRDSLKALSDEGYITAEQFALWSSRLDVLEKLQIKELQAAEAVQTMAQAAGEASEEFAQIPAQVLEEASSGLRDVMSRLDQNVASAESALRSVYDREMQALESATSNRNNAIEALREAYRNQAEALNSTADKFRQLQSGLLAFSSTLAEAAGGGADVLTLSRRFASLVSLGKLGNAEAMAALPEVGAQLKNQIMATATDRTSMVRQLAAMRMQTDAVAGVAGRQVSNAEAQLAALNAQVSALISLEQKTMSVEEAVTNLQSAEQAYQLAQEQKKALTEQVSGLIQLNESVLSVAEAIAQVEEARAEREAVVQQIQQAGFSDLIETTKQTSAEIVAAIFRMINETRSVNGLSSVATGTTTTASSSQTYDPSASANDPETILSNEVTALRDDMNNLMYNVAKNTAKTYDIFSRWDSDGMPELRVLA